MPQDTKYATEEFIKVNTDWGTSGYVAERAWRKAGKTGTVQVYNRPTRDSNSRGAAKDQLKVSGSVPEGTRIDGDAGVAMHIDRLAEALGVLEGRMDAVEGAKKDAAPIYKVEYREGSQTKVDEFGTLARAELYFATVVSDPGCSNVKLYGQDGNVIKRK